MKPIDVLVDEKTDATSHVASLLQFQKSSPIMFKPIDSHTTVAFKVYKSWSITYDNISSMDSSINKARYVSHSLSTDYGNNPSGLNIRALYDTIYKSYYLNDNPFDTFGSGNNTEIRNLGTYAIVASIANRYVGERIKPTSVYITDNSRVDDINTMYYQDDGLGNLYDVTEANVVNDGVSSGNFVGNVFYEHGIIVITNTTYPYQYLLRGVEEHGGDTNYGYVITYKSTKTIREHEILITTNPNEHQMSMNPTAQLSDGSTFKSFVTSSEWTPYIASIGFYDDDLNLLAIGKYTRPIKKLSDASLTFSVRFDE